MSITNDVPMSPEFESGGNYRCRRDRRTVPRDNLNVDIDGKRRADFTLLFCSVTILHSYPLFFVPFITSTRIRCRVFRVPCRLAFRMRAVALFHTLCRVPRRTDVLCRPICRPRIPAAAPFAALPSCCPPTLAPCHTPRGVNFQPR